MRLVIESHEERIIKGKSGILDLDFINSHTSGYEALRNDVLNTNWQ